MTTASIATTSSSSTSAELLAELQRYVVAVPRLFAVGLALSPDMYLVGVEGEQLFGWTGYYGAKVIAHHHTALYGPDTRDGCSLRRTARRPIPSASPTAFAGCQLSATRITRSSQADMVLFFQAMKVV